MREQFEKLPSVAKYLEFVVWNSETKGYCNNSGNLVPLDFASFLNGAWYAFREQQKKIDRALEIGYEKRGNVHYLVDEHIDEIQGVLE